MTAPASPHDGAVRGDIEGLRAVAVALVIGYHFFPALLPGGYVGVDVFFVISGYLITHSLLHALPHAPTRTAWLCDFWARRVRRLLPNALLVLVASGVAGLLLYSDFSLKRLGSDIAWAAVFSANWLFVLRSIDYLVWDEAQSTLLHFWSLAVEEQFYLVWPLLLLVILHADSPGRRAAWAAAFAACSLAAAVAMSATNLTQAFFSTPARAWELLFGAALALRATPCPSGLRGPACALGLLMIAVSASVFSDDTRHPGLVTLLPVVGSALVVAADAAGRGASRWLAHPAMQAVGARSYSIYLWHWPVLMFGGSSVLVRESALGTTLLLLLALVAAELAYRAVERPARFVWLRSWSSRRLLAVGLSAAALVAAFGLLVRAQAANDLRELFGQVPAPRTGGSLPPLAQVRADLPAVYRSGCHLGVDAEVSPECAAGATGATDTVVLFGDSHAAQWFSAIDVVASARGLRLHSWTKSSCPSADVPVWNAMARGAYRQCDTWREATLQRIEALRPRLVILSNLIEAAPVLADASGARPIRGREAAEAWSLGFERVIARLQRAGLAVVVLRDVPRPRPDVLDCIYAASDATRCELGVAEATATPPLDVAAAQRRGAILWDLTAEICPGGHCTVVRPQTHQPVYRDFNHLTDTEVRRLAPAIDARWAALPAAAHGLLR